jgi:hypothetical protein
MAENRRAARASANTRGKVTLVGRPDIDCTVRDLSAFGARLQFRVRTFLPRSFQLRFEGMDKEARVVWQSGMFAGVRFAQPLPLQTTQRKRSLWSSLRGR